MCLILLAGQSHGSSLSRRPGEHGMLPLHSGHAPHPHSSCPLPPCATPPSPWRCSEPSHQLPPLPPPVHRKSVELTDEEKAAKELKNLEDRPWLQNKAGQGKKGAKGPRFSQRGVPGQKPGSRRKSGDNVRFGRGG